MTTIAVYKTPCNVLFVTMTQFPLFIIGLAYYGRRLERDSVVDVASAFRVGIKTCARGRKAEGVNSTLGSRVVLDISGQKLYECGSKKYQRVRRCLIYALPRGTYSELPGGIRLNAALGDLGFDSEYEFIDCCVHSKFPNRKARIGEREAVVEKIGVVLRDRNGCFLGYHDVDRIAEVYPGLSFPNQKLDYSKDVVEVKATVPLDEARDSISRSIPVNELVVNGRLCAATKKALANPYLPGIQQDAQDYWDSQSGVLWRVYDCGEDPICKIPFNFLRLVFGNRWFCSEEFTAQLMPSGQGKRSRELAELAQSIAEAFYIPADSIGEACRPLYEVGEKPKSAKKYAEWVYGKWFGVFKNDIVRVVDSDNSLLCYRKLDDVRGRFHPIVRKGHVASIRVERKHNAKSRRYFLRRGMLDENVTDEMRMEMLDELKKEEPFLRVATVDGDLIGFYPEASAWRRWSVVSVSQNNDMKISDAIAMGKRLSLLRLCKRQSRKLEPSQRDEVEKEILNITESIREKTLDNQRRRPIDACGYDTAEILRGMRCHLSDLKYADSTICEVEKVLRRRTEDGKVNVIVMRVGREMAAKGCGHAIVNGAHADSRKLVTDALALDQHALAKVAELLADDIERAGALATSADSESKPMPIWAMSRRDFVFEWAKRTLASEDRLKAQPSALFVAHAIQSREANVFVFDEELYDEVIHADAAEGGEYDADAFPYPVCIIALRELGDVFGVAVCRAEDVSRFAGRERTACPDANGLCTFFIGDGPGGLDVDEGMRDLADKLVAYLECDNANVETVYVDGVRAPDGRDAPGDATARERDYRVGSDYATGVRVVVEGERRVGQGPRRARRSHFRRGHYSRYRVGPRDRWHYETRWVRPTFVHGCGLSVTEHKVIRIVL